MRRPYVEPGLRSARPGIRHRARTNGPDRKGRDPKTLPAAVDSSDGDRPLPSRLDSETEDDVFFSGDDAGAQTHTEDDREDQDDDDDDEDDEDEDEEEEDSDRRAGNRLRRDEDGLNNEAQASRPTGTRPRAWSGSRKLAPEEEEWAIKDERKRRKGGVFGRLKLLGRKNKNDSGDDVPGRAYGADDILGRSRSAVTELRSRRSTLRQPAAPRERPPIPRGSFGRRAAAAALESGAYPYPSNRDGDESASESGTASPKTPVGIPDEPPRITTPIALRAADNPRSPEIIDPFDLDTSKPEHLRTKSLNAEIVSNLPPPSPLLPESGPLSHKDAVIPSQRPSMQGARDDEIDEETASRRDQKDDSASNIDIRSAAGGALGGIATMIGLDALRENRKGYVETNDDDKTKEVPEVDDAERELEPADELVKPDTKSKKAKKKKSKRKLKNASAAAAGATAGTGAGALAVDLGEPITAETALQSPTTGGPSELPYTIGDSPTEERQIRPIEKEDEEVKAIDEPRDDEEADSETEKKSKGPLAAAIAVPVAVGAGLGGLAAAAFGGSKDASDDAAHVDAPASPVREATKKKKTKKEKKEKKKEAQRSAVSVDDEPLVEYAAVPRAERVDEEETPRLKKKKSKRNKDLAAAAAVTGAAAAPIYTLTRGDDENVDDLPPPPPRELESQPYPDEKTDYANFGLAAAAADDKAPTRKRSTKASKGSRPVEKLPMLDEDVGLAPPRAATKDFLLTPSVAPSEADPLDVGPGRRASRAYLEHGDWLSSVLNPQQTHYFLREMTRRELSWELDRAWLLTSFEKPTKESKKAQRHKYDSLEDDSRINDFDDTSDEDLLDNSDEEDEEAVFRRPPDQVAQAVPDLPLLRFLFKNAFCTFPLFVAPEDKLSSYGSTPPDKATIARSYFFTGILPLLRAIQSRSLSAYIDRHGEGDGTPFSARSTTGIVRALLLKWTSKYVTAVLRVGNGDPYFGEEEPLRKESWPWPASNLLPPEAFFAYRRPLDGIKYGGYEADVVGIRRSSPTERDYIICVRRPNRIDEYVVRNDADFQEFQKNLSRDLGEYAFVHKLPKTRGQPDEESEDEDLASTPRGSVRASGFNAAGIGAALQTYKDSSGRNSTNSLVGRRQTQSKRSLADRFANNDRERKRRYSSGVQDGRPVLGRSVDDLIEDDDYEEESVRDVRRSRRAPPPVARGRRGEVFSDDEDDGDVSDDTLRRRPTRRERGSDPADELTEDGRGPKPKKSLLSIGLGSMRKSRPAPGRDDSPRGGSDRRDSLDSRRRGDVREPRASIDARNGTARSSVPPPLAARSRRGAPAPAVEQSPRDFEARRQKLREWLRDTLSIRESGHAVETQNFLSIGSFPERALRRQDLMDIDERRREDKYRRREHEMDTGEAGDDVHELRDIRDDLWADCVEGDGFLKMYDALREKPTYASLPVNYQKMVSWGNLQIARVLYGTFVAGDESRANLARLQDVYESIPWKKLAFAMKSPVTQMVRSWQDNLLRKNFLQAVLHVILEDDPDTIDEDLVELRRSIGSEVMFRKLRAFVESPDDLKRLIRQHAEKAEIPLVAAIVRGSEQPKLNKAEVQRVMDATQAYQDFIKTQPNVIKKNAHKEPGYLLITDLQRALRLLSLQRDGAQVRGMLQDPAIGDALGSLFEPLMEELRRIHKVKGSSNSLMALQGFLGRLIDHLFGLRARVQDPARSINGIAEMLDDAAPEWYSFLYRYAEASPTVFSFFAWFRHLAMTVGAGTEDLASIWTDPPAAPQEDDDTDTLSRGVDEDKPRGVLDANTMRDINSISEYGRRKRNRQMEIACRWAAGEADAHHSVQVPGDGTGKTRTEPYFPREPRPARRAPGLDRFRKSFREAVSIALAR